MRCRRFTLIELLVVVAIIAVLAAMLLPALARSREISKRTVCRGNMRTVAMGVTMYADDHAEWLPVGIRNAGPPGIIEGIPNMIPDGTYKSVLRYVGDGRVWQCVNSGYAKDGAVYDGPYNSWYIGSSYLAGHKPHASMIGGWKSAQTLRESVNREIMTDMTLRWEAGQTGAMHSSSGRKWVLSNIPIGTLRSAGVNVATIDGAVEWRKQTKVTEREVYYSISGGVPQLKPSGVRFFMYW